MTDISFNSIEFINEFCLESFDDLSEYVSVVGLSDLFVQKPGGSVSDESTRFVSGIEKPLYRPSWMTSRVSTRLR
jgi:hypothetical protein